MAREPYCSDCGQALGEHAESASCPGCGRTVTDVLVRDPVVRGHGKRWQSRARIFGMPFVHVALGPHEDERFGRAVGIIAIGDRAVGWFAFGGIAIGIVAVGGLSMGVVSLGGLGLGLLALGGAALGGVALGGLGVGVFAMGGGAIGYAVQGGGALGHFARGGQAVGTFVDTAARSDPQAVQFFADWSWLFGATPAQMLPFVLFLVGSMLAVSLCCGLAVLAAYVARPRQREYG